MGEYISEQIFSTIGGHISVDFVNTTDGDLLNQPGTEYLATYTDLVAWGNQKELLSDADVEHLLAEAEQRPEEAAAIVEEAHRLRRTLYRLFYALAQNVPAPEADVASFNATLSAALMRLRLTPVEDGFAWAWAEDEAALDPMLWPVVREAADLMTSDERRKMRECSGDTCGWLFLDTSKNHSRQWCDMKDCGNKAKARRHYQRRRRKEAQPA